MIEQFYRNFLIVYEDEFFRVLQIEFVNEIEIWNLIIYSLIEGSND